MKRVKRSALVSLVVGVCHLVAACGEDGEGSGGGSGTTSGETSATGTVDDTTTATTTTTTATSSSTGGGDGGGGGTPSDPCEPTDGEAIPPTCGIFVDGDAEENGNGQQDNPYNNLTDAVAQAGGANNRIYVCGSIREPVTVPEGLEIHGEIQCGSWQWDFEVRTLWEAFGDYVPLHFVGGAAPTTITGFRIEARDAVAAGQSSIAVIAEGGTLSLVRSDVVAGDATAGAPGESGAAGAPGTPGGAGGYGSSQTAGAGGVSTCGGATGGTGAFESCFTPLPNQPPACIINPATPPGAGGTTGATTCTAGDPGDPGAPGSAGADASGLGSISADGFIGLDGGAGTSGAVGGAGGGGGAKSEPDRWGGGGGSGGCGSEGSTGGKGGGSSFAFVSLNATILFDEVTASVGFGGDGGAGGAATPGGAGGDGGLGGCGLIVGCPTARACAGGDGGKGGDGGAGGNGAGGHAAIIAYSGVQNSLDGLIAEAPVDQGGLSGGGMASDGQSAVELQFP